jgi:hypothetical protein
MCCLDLKEIITPSVSLLLGLGTMLFSYKQLSRQTKKSKQSQWIDEFRFTMIEFIDKATLRPGNYWLILTPDLTKLGISVELLLSGSKDIVKNKLETEVKNLINLFQTNNGVGDFPVKEYEKILLNIKSLTVEIIKQENEQL